MHKNEKMVQGEEKEEEKYLGGMIFVSPPCFPPSEILNVTLNVWNKLMISFKKY